jgi:hypothetical protein
MTKHPFFLCLISACLAALPLAACAPSGVAPGLPAATASAPEAPVRAIDSLEAGDATVNFGLGLQGQGAARRVLYASGEIESLEIALYWVNNGEAEPTLLRTESLTQAELAADPTLSFQKLKRDRQYRVIATARRTIDGTLTVINDVTLSQAAFSIGHSQAQLSTTLDDLPVVLLDTPAAIYTAGVALTAKAGELSHPALAGTLTANTITAATLTFEGTRARVVWTSAHAGGADYDVTITPVGDPTALVVNATGSDPELGTAHNRSFELGTVAYGDYKATVRIKGRPGTDFSHTASFAQPISAATITYEGGKAKVAWKSASAAEADYDVTVQDASGETVLSDVGYDTQSTTNHFVKLDLASKPYGTYSAKVRLKDRPATEISATAAAFNNTVVGTSLTITGTDAKIAWNSGIDRATDFELELLNASDTVVLSDEVTAETGKIHSKTLTMGSTPSGSYRARVKAKNAPASEAKTSTAVAYAVAGDAPEITGSPELIILGNGGYYILTFKTDSAASTEYTLKIFQGSFGGAIDTPLTPFNVTQSGTDHVYARMVDASATMPLAANMNYRIEIWAGGAKIGESDIAPYVVGADPIIGQCTVNPPTCEFVAPPAITDGSIVP